MRIASFSPAATEWICVFGAGAELVARSNPDAMADYREEVRLLRPDLVVLDAAPAGEQMLPDLEMDLTTADGARPGVLVFSPTTLKQVLDGALRIGHAIGRSDMAMPWIAHAEASLHRMRTSLGLHRRVDEDVLPTVALLKGLEPPTVAGYWVPDMIAMAGGRATLTRAGRPHGAISQETILEADPDIILLACGNTGTADGHRHSDDQEPLRRFGNELRAGKNGYLYCVDGGGWVDYPGPQIYRAIEKLAAIFAERRRGKR